MSASKPGAEQHTARRLQSLGQEVRAERLARKAALQAVRDRFPHSRGKAYVLLLDYSIFEDFLAEYSRFAPDDSSEGTGLLRFLSAQLASGVTLWQICEHYCVAPGLVCAWLIEEPERLERCRLAWNTGAELRRQG